jgi:hypothetical protein
MAGYGRDAHRTIDNTDERPRRDWDANTDYPGLEDGRTQHNLWPDDTSGLRPSKKPPGKFQTAMQSKADRLAFAAYAAKRPHPEMTYTAPAMHLSANELNAIATLAVAAGMIQPNQALGVARTLLRAYLASITFQTSPDETPHDLAYRPASLPTAQLRLAIDKLNAALVGDYDLASTLAGRVLASVTRVTR